VQGVSRVVGGHSICLAFLYQKTENLPLQLYGWRPALLSGRLSNRSHPFPFPLPGRTISEQKAKVNAFPFEVGTSAFVGTNPIDESITSGLPVFVGTHLSLAN
jgi:hypothetical protein